MRKPNRYNPWIKRLTHLFCYIIGVTFIASGFLKAVDPWGTAMKFEEYFTVYGFDFLLPLSRVLAIWLCGAEFMMGLMILCRVRLRLISIFALISMAIFTVVTLLSVTLYPVDDCGCFGEALYLTPMQTLIKNLIILPMIITIWWRYRPDRILVYKPREVVLATIFCVVTMGFSAYNYLYLPVIDFLPYKVGTDLLEEKDIDKVSEVVLVYKNLANGEVREFSLDDKEWQDESKWEWVETLTKEPETSYKSEVSDFVLTTCDGDDVTEELLIDREVELLAITDLDNISSLCLRKIERYIKSSDDLNSVAIITSKDINTPYYIIAGIEVPCYHIDDTTFKSIMRAYNGVVELDNGVITSKRSCLSL